MRIYRCILPDWATAKTPTLRKVVEGILPEDRIASLNNLGYNIYYLPNHPLEYKEGSVVDGSMVDVFNCVFVDMDLKEGKYGSKDEFISALAAWDVMPTTLVDSGNGIHAYWDVKDLDAKSFMYLQRRLCRKFNTDEAVCKIYQLMRVPGTYNTKDPENKKLCEIIYSSGISYTCEQLDTGLPPITPQDQAYCDQHINKTFKLHEDVVVDTKLPPKFGLLLRNSKEAQDIWGGNITDRSKGDYRLAHLMWAHNFTKEEAMSVLVNCAKALTRAPAHRISYAENIVNQIWVDIDQNLDLSYTVEEVLKTAGEGIKGTRFPCWNYIDATEHGFRLGQVIGLVAGSGVGKTAMALNMFMGFVKNNPEYDHFFIPLEQPVNEIADRWKMLCGDQTTLHSKVHLISNYAPDNSFRHLSFDEIRSYILNFTKKTGKKIGCVVIDHIGALKKKGKNGENQDLMDICHEMKAFAIETNTMLIMQSQAPREKAGIGDLELNKDAAYGTVYFESYCDYLVTIWQPLKRCYSEEGCPIVTAYKFCKIRHKKLGFDQLQEDVCYRLLFNPGSGHLRPLTEIEEKSFDFFVEKATNLRKKDRKTDLVAYSTIKWIDKDTRDTV